MDTAEEQTAFVRLDEIPRKEVHHFSDGGSSTEGTKATSVTRSKKLDEVSKNHLLTYFKEIGQKPILSREQEQFHAKKLKESEQAKKVYKEKWMLLLSSMLSWKTINKYLKSSSDKSHRKVLFLIKTIKNITSLDKEIKSRERLIAKGNLSYYRRNILCRENADLFIQKDKAINRSNIIELYRSGTVNQLKAFIKANYPDKKQNKLIHILRRFIKSERQAKYAKDMLVRSHLRLVVMIAKKYAQTSGALLLSDLIQEGNMGLIRAVEKFDYRLGNRLSTYASWWIRQNIVRSIEDKSSTIRIPVYINTKINKLLKDSKQTDSPDNEDSPNFTDNKSLQSYLSLQLSKDPVSLDTPYAEDGSNLHDCIPDNMPPSSLDQVLKYQLLEVMDETLKGLPPRDERILRLRFGIGGDFEHSLDEIGKKFGISRERIRQIESAALKKIRASKKSEILRPFLTNDYN
jgi:RNA polymerase sigma factor (sigma-70 family)